MTEPKRPLKVFLCHAHADRDPVRGLYARLTKDGVDVWLDKEKLLPGQDWELEIRKAVRDTDVVVVCLSKQFNQDGFRQKEVRLALDVAMEKREDTIFIIPARLEECDTLESLRKWHWVDLFEEDGYERLMKTLRFLGNIEDDAFVIMPFAEEYKTFYYNVIKKTLEEMNIVGRRVDDLYTPRSSLSGILKYIESSRFILADLSGRNPNVFFEVGISHAIGKSVLLLTQALEDVPPMLQTIRCHLYESSLAGALKTKETIKKSIQEIRQTNYPSFFKSQSFNMVPRTCVALSPGSQKGERTYRDLILPASTIAQCKIERSKNIFNTTSLPDEIWACINSAEIVIADLTSRDPDVFYLVGLAFGLKKKIIYLAEDGIDIPFDLKTGSHLIYLLEPFAAGLRSQQILTELIKSISM